METRDERVDSAVVHSRCNALQSLEGVCQLKSVISGVNRNVLADLRETVSIYLNERRNLKAISSRESRYLSDNNQIPCWNL